MKQFYDLCSNDIESFKVILIGTISCVPTDQLPKEIIKSALDDFENGLIVNNAENPFVKGQNANILDIENMKEIDAEDIQPIEEDNEGLWTKFCQYINELFEDELIFFNNTIKENQERRKPLNPILDLPFYKTKSGDHTITQGSYVSLEFQRVNTFFSTKEGAMLIARVKPNISMFFKAMITPNCRLLRKAKNRVIL